MKWNELIGKKIVAYRGYKEKRFGKTTVSLNFILFDDNETYLELREQDQYDYHDCCSSARSLDLRKDAKLWERMMNKEGFEEHEGNDSDPFW